jgi:hypothetical protein
MNEPKKYPVPIADDLQIVGMMSFKQAGSLAIEVDQIWVYEPKTQGFNNREALGEESLRTLDVAVAEFFPVYSIGKDGVRIFVYVPEEGFGYFVDISKQYIKAILLPQKSNKHPQRN